MHINQELLNELKQQIIKRCANPDFIHHYWFITYHIEIVETIALELCDIYKHADQSKVLVLAWLHDYEKIVDFDNQYNTELLATTELMQQIGFDRSFIHETCMELNIYNAKKNLQEAAIEVQIVSSADAASHFVGPFGALYWYENPTMPMEEILDERLRKITVDWEKKITLPEIKEAFLHRYNYAKESAGHLPKRYLS